MSKGLARRDCCRQKREHLNREIADSQFFQKQSWNYEQDFKDIE